MAITQKYFKLAVTFVFCVSQATVQPVPALENVFAHQNTEQASLMITGSNCICEYSPRRKCLFVESFPQSTRPYWSKSSLMG